MSWGYLRHETILKQVDDISNLIQGLASNDPKEQERALRKADILLHEKDLKDEDPDKVECDITQERSQINKIPDKQDDGGGDMSQDAFMRMVEKDAKERSENRKQRKQESDAFRKKGNILFGKKDYAGALYNFNEAIKLIKDSPCLYNNRALTYLRLGIYTSVMDDCDRALELETYSLRARMYKAKALFLAGEPEKCREELGTARKVLPGHLDVIDEYEQEVFNMGRQKHEYNSDQEKVWQDAANFKGEFAVTDDAFQPSPKST
ncbi:Tetratricopeptide repeat protein 12 [Orchesella cincta]|uniref:Tetratricopeptide repeat protein 12 n=1 Tax=Orchesella cincta TaxID=48709 RepID=A0A1D2ME52_ORCCI|nr:Tetratricopeptide repeat protein 12 [Orchesella cincta]